MNRANDRIKSITYISAATGGLILAGYFLAMRSYSPLWYVLLGTAALFFPYVLSRTFHVRMTYQAECLAVVVIWSSCMLGEALGVYERVLAWDDLMHLASGFLFCSFGFAVWEIPDGARRALAGLSFSTTAGVAWELIEYFCDRVFRTEMQKDVLLTSVSSHILSPTGDAFKLDNIGNTVLGGIVLDGALDIGLYDTMNDLVMATMGALVFLMLYRIDMAHGTRLSRPFIPHRQYEIWDGKQKQKNEEMPEK